MMANDNRRSHRVEENNKLKKKNATPDASPASSSRRLTRETARINESAAKESPISTRKSERLGKRKPSGTTPTKGKPERSRELVSTTPVKKNDSRKKEKASPAPATATSNMKSKKAKVVNRGKKRKRVGTFVNKGLSKPSPVKTEEGDDNDKESEEALSEDNSSSSCRVVEKPDSTQSVEDKDDSDVGCRESNGEESTMEASERQSKTSDQKECSNDRFIDQELDRTPCEAGALTKTDEGNNGVSRTDRSICIACKKLRCYHLPLVAESIWDTREVEVSEAQGLQKQKQYFVKYKGLAHIHNQWITEPELLLEAPLLVETYNKIGSTKWNEEWTMPHQLLKKRLLLSLENTETTLNHHYEWLVQWKGLDHEQATWEAENISVIDSPEGHSLIKDYERDHVNAKKDGISDNDRIEEIPVKLPPFFAGYPPGMDNIHYSYVKNLHDAWTRGQTSIVFDDQERTARIVLFLLSLKSVSMPFLLITRSDSLSQWEAMFSIIATFNAFKVSLENTHEKANSKLLHVRKEGGQLVFQLLLYTVDAFVKDLNVLKAIKWEAVVVDESQSSDISLHFCHIKSLSTDKRLLVFCGPLGVSNLDVLPLLGCGVITKTELDDVSKLKETLSKLIAYECKSSSSKFVEYWVPVQISNVQLEQYCSMLLSNAMALSACSKSDATGALYDVLVSNRKCCDHPYIVDQSLQAVLTKDLEPIKFLDVGIKASGKLQVLDLILPEMRKHQLRVLIVFQPLSGSGKDSTSIGDILDDFVRQRFGADSYERVDGIGMIPSKKQAALNNFNNKEMGRFIFLLEYRACLPSIKLSSVDSIILFGSDWNPANDLRALQRIVIDSHPEQIMTFRLYTSSTLEEKILMLAEHNVTIDSRLQSISRSTRDQLLMWGAKYLFKKLDEFHSDLNISSEEHWLNELMEEFVDLISFKFNNKDASKLKITRAKPVCGKNVTFPNDLDGEQPHTFWSKLLVGRDPCWKYLARSTPRQRTTKRPQYFEESPKKTNVNSDDVGRKRKKIINNVPEPVASKPVIEEGETTNSISDHVASKPVIQGENTNNGFAPVASKPVIEEEMNFPDLLKLKISKLCEVLKLPEDVKMKVLRFLKYVIENYRVDKWPENTLHAFLISLCWIGSELLKHKLDRKQSISLAKEHLDFCCREDEANSVYLKLELAKEMFLLHKVNDDDDNVGGGGGDCNQKDGEVGTINSDTSNALEDQNNNNNPVQPSVSPASGQSVPANLVNEFYSEASLLQPVEEPSLPSENQSNVYLGEQQPDLQNPLVVESCAQVPNQGGTPFGSNEFYGSRSGNSNQGAPRKKSYDPLQAEFDRLFDLKNKVVKYHEDIKLKIKSEHEKELAEIIAQVNAKYEAKIQEADTSFMKKNKLVETYINRVLMNKVLAEAYRSKCQDLSPICSSDFQAIQSEGMQHLPQFQGQQCSNGVTVSSSPAQSSRRHPVTGSQPALQIVNQSSKLFSTPPTSRLQGCRLPPSNTNPTTRPPPSTVILTGTPSQPPFTSGIPSGPPPHIPPILPSSRYIRLPPNIIPAAPSARNLRITEIRAPAPHIRHFRIPTSASPHDHRAMPGQHLSNSSPRSQTSIPLQTPTFPTNHNSQPTQNSPITSPSVSSQPASVPVAPPASVPVAPPASVPVAPPASVPVAPPASVPVAPPASVPVAPPASVPVAPPASVPVAPPASVPVAPPASVPVAPPALVPVTPPASVPVAPPASFQLPSWQPTGIPPATLFSSLPPMPSVSISHTGLYNPAPDISSHPTPDLSTDIDKQDGCNPPSASSPSPPDEMLEMTDFGKESGGSDLVCLSDDD